MNGFSYAVFTAEAGPVALIALSCEDQEMGGCWTAQPALLRLAAPAIEDPATAIALLRAAVPNVLYPAWLITRRGTWHLLAAATRASWFYRWSTACCSSRLRSSWASAG